MKQFGWLVLLVILVATGFAGEKPKDTSSLTLKRVATTLRLTYPQDSVKRFLDIPPLEKQIAAPDSLMSQSILPEIAGDRLWISDDLNVAAIVTTQQDTIMGSPRYFVTIRILYNYRDDAKK